MYVFIFCTIFVWNTSHSKNPARFITNIHRSSRKVPIILPRLQWHLNILTDFWKIMKYQSSWKPIQWEHRCSMCTDRQTDVTKLIVAFHNFANAPKKYKPVDNLWTITWLFPSL
jgi:hypothetical protein